MNQVIWLLFVLQQFMIFKRQRLLIAQFQWSLCILLNLYCRLLNTYAVVVRYTKFTHIVYSISCTYAIFYLYWYLLHELIHIYIYSMGRFSILLDWQIISTDLFLSIFQIRSIAYLSTYYLHVIAQTYLRKLFIHIIGTYFSDYISIYENLCIEENILKKMPETAVII